MTVASSIKETTEKSVKKIGRKTAIKATKPKGAKLGSKKSGVVKKGSPELKSRGRKVNPASAPKKIEVKVKRSIKSGEGIRRAPKSTKNTSMLKAKKPVETKAKVKQNPIVRGPSVDHKAAPKKLNAKVKASTKMSKKASI